MPNARSVIVSLAATAALLVAVSVAIAQGGPPNRGDGRPAPPPIDWRTEEASVLRHHRQLTFREQYVKAGESYFSPDGRRVVFQAVEVPADGSEPEEFYAMIVADVVHDDDGRVKELANHRRISPVGSANTCGWFHPTDPNIVLFASTIVAPTASTPPGYQRGTGRYRWMFPPEMTIVSVDLRTADGTFSSLTPLVEHAGAYMAECSLTPDGRHLLYCSLESNEGDLFVKDLKTGTVTHLVDARGYDGGPFFSPDGRRITYRSDRRGNNQLQIFVADLVFDDDGTIVGIGPEFQLTNDGHVNWCPFWHPDGRHLFFASSRLGHFNYEIFVIDADPGAMREGGSGSVRYGTNLRRVTFADGADVLPAFSPDGRFMIWTGQRDPDATGGRTSQLWVADLVLDLDAPGPGGI